jgi:hypothetical protein
MSSFEKSLTRMKMNRMKTTAKRRTTAIGYSE